MLKKLLRLFIGLDLTSLIKKAIAGAGLPLGGLIAWFAGFFIKRVEETVDKAADGYINISDADEAADKKAADSIKQLDGAKTDEEFDQAVRNSLKP